MRARPTIVAALIVVAISGCVNPWATLESRLVPGGIDSYAVSPNGNLIVVSEIDTERTRNLALYDIREGSTTPLLDWDNLHLHDPAFSADGNQIAFSLTHFTTKAGCTKGNSSLAVLDMRNNQVRNLTAMGPPTGRLHWIQDSLVFNRHAGRIICDHVPTYDDRAPEIWSYDFQSGESRLVYDKLKSIGLASVTSFSADGKRIMSNQHKPVLIDFDSNSVNEVVFPPSETSSTFSQPWSRIACMDSSERYVAFLEDPSDSFGDDYQTYLWDRQNDKVWKSPTTHESGRACYHTSLASVVVLANVGTMNRGELWIWDPNETEKRIL